MHCPWQSALPEQTLPPSIYRNWQNGVPVMPPWLSYPPFATQILDCSGVNRELGWAQLPNQKQMEAAIVAANR
jgi:hypothetical protein